MTPHTEPGTQMDIEQPVYDSITAGALRMARRHWYVVVAAAALGVAAGLLLTSQGNTWTAEASVRIRFDSVKSQSPTKDTDRSTVDPLSIARRADDSKGDVVSLPSGVGVDITGDTIAGSITIEATGPTEQAVSQAADSVAVLTSELIIDEATALTETKVAGLEQHVAGSTERLRVADERLAARQAAGESPGPTDPVVLERIAAADALATASSELEQARSELGALAEGTVAMSETTASESDSSLLLPAALGTLGAAAAFAVLLVIQALDGRIRRRIQLERSAPRAKVLGVLPKTPSDGQLALLRHVVEKFVAESGLQRLLVSRLRGTVDEEIARALGEEVGCPVESVEPTAVLGELGTPGLGVVFAVPFGRVPDDLVQSTVSDAFAAGTTAVALILTDVPSADRAWASVSIN